MQSIPHPNDAPDEIWLWLASWFQRYSCLKLWTHGRTHARTPARVPYYKLTLSLRLWWAKNLICPQHPQFTMTSFITWLLVLKKIFECFCRLYEVEHVMWPRPFTWYINIPIPFLWRLHLKFGSGELINQPISPDDIFILVNKLSCSAVDYLVISIKMLVTV